MTQDEIRDIFARAAGDRFITKEERGMAGAKAFKRKALGLFGGLFGGRAEKTLDEMAQLLHVTGIASSVKEGREITQTLPGKRIDYKRVEHLYEGCHHHVLEFYELLDGKGNKKYGIEAGVIF